MHIYIYTHICIYIYIIICIYIHIYIYEHHLFLSRRWLAPTLLIFMTWPFTFCQNKVCAARLLDRARMGLSVKIWFAGHSATRFVSRIRIFITCTGFSTAHVGGARRCGATPRVTSWPRDRQCSSLELTTCTESPFLEWHRRHRKIEHDRTLLPYLPSGFCYSIVLGPRQLMKPWRGFSQHWHFQTQQACENSILPEKQMQYPDVRCQENGSESFSDVTVRCDGGSLFLHRNILMSRSEYFKAMFQAGTVVLFSNFLRTNTLLCKSECDADVTGSWEWFSRKPELGCRGQLTLWERSKSLQIIVGDM